MSSMAEGAYRPRLSPLQALDGEVGGGVGVAIWVRGSELQGGGRPGPAPQAPHGGAGELERDHGRRVGRDRLGDARERERAGAGGGSTARPAVAAPDLREGSVEDDGRVLSALNGQREHPA